MNKSKSIILLVIVVFVAIGIVIASYLISTNQNNAKINNLLNSSEAMNNTSEEKQNKIEGTSNDQAKTKIKVSYSENVVRKLNVGSANFICKEYIPHITGIDDQISEKMEKHLTDIYANEWTSIQEQTKDKDILDILEVQNMNNSGDIGFTQSCELIYENSQVATFKCSFEGGLGGVSWDKTSGVSFNINTGEIINIKDIITDEDGFKEACYDYVIQELKEDNRYQYLQNGYQTIVKGNIGKLEGYFTKDGIVCVHIARYQMASGGAGEFVYAVPYSIVKDYINIKYAF